MKRAGFSIILVVVFLLAGSCAKSDEMSLPPELPSEKQWDSIPSTLHSSPVSKLMLGQLAVELERTNLGEVRKAVGVGKIQHRGDAGGSESWLCYTTSAHEGPLHVWLISGEMGGTDRTILSFIAEAGGPATESCPQLPLKFSPASLSNSLWLGSNVKQLKTALGEPSARIGDWWVYSYAGKVSGRHQDQHETQFDITSSLEAKIERGTIVALSASQVTSY